MSLVGHADAGVGVCGKGLKLKGTETAVGPQ